MRAAFLIGGNQVVRNHEGRRPYTGRNAGNPSDDHLMLARHGEARSSTRLAVVTSLHGRVFSSPFVISSSAVNGCSVRWPMAGLPRLENRLVLKPLNWSPGRRRGGDRLGEQLQQGVPSLVAALDSWLNSRRPLALKIREGPQNHARGRAVGPLGSRCQPDRSSNSARLLQTVTFSLQIDECRREEHDQLMRLIDLVWSLADVDLAFAYFNQILLGHALDTGPSGIRICTKP